MSQSIWRRQLRSWLPPLIVLLVALAGLLFYRLAFAGEARAGGRQIERRAAEVQRLTVERETTERLVRRLRNNKNRIDRFRDKRLATEAERLTVVIAEVKELARRAGVEPSSIRYPQERIEEVGLTRRQVRFSVDGDYAGLRRFINFLELSDLFLTLEEVSLSGRSGDSSALRIGLTVSTLFRAAPPEASASAQGASS